LSRHLDGYDWARKEFVFEDRKVYPVTVGRPEYLELSLRSKRDGPIDSVSWYDPLQKAGQPEYDWNALRVELEGASNKLTQYQWLEDWKSAAKGRRVRLQVLGKRSGEFDWFAQSWAIQRWQIAHLRGKPAYFVMLHGEQSNRTLGLAFGREENRVLVYWSATEGDYVIRHSLDRIGLRTWGWREDSPRLYQQYAVIEPSGNWSLHTYLD
jgi:hypothetical protein